MPRSLGDITGRLAELREFLPEDRVRHVAAFRAQKWFRFAERLERDSPESKFIDEYRERAENWAKAAQS